MDTIVILLLSVALLGVFMFVGQVTEKKHLQSLAKREATLADVMVTTLKRPCGNVLAGNPPSLVCGEAVVASDGFKTWLFGLRNLIGGESKSFSRLYDRARREATVRMLEKAKDLGYNAICNVRYESADVGGNTSAGGKRKNPMAVCAVSGTAYRMA